jgi:choline kinase
MNCDVLCHPAILDRLLECPGSAFAYDPSSGDDDEHMKVELADEYLIAMSKRLARQQTQGENVGILDLRKWAVRLLFREVKGLLKVGGQTMWIAAAIEKLAYWIPLRGIDVADLPWIEIDFPKDLADARECFTAWICHKSAKIANRALCKNHYEERSIRYANAAA